MHCISYIIWLEVLFHTFAYSLTNLFKLRPEILKLKKKTNKKTNWKKKKKKSPESQIQRQLNPKVFSIFIELKSGYMLSVLHNIKQA